LLGRLARLDLGRLVSCTGMLVFVIVIPGVGVTLGLVLGVLDGCLESVSLGDLFIDLLNLIILTGQ
jgi:uncharacterized membrane protein